MLLGRKWEGRTNQTGNEAANPCRENYFLSLKMT